MEITNIKEACAWYDRHGNPTEKTLPLKYLDIDEYIYDYDQLLWLVAGDVKNIHSKAFIPKFTELWNRYKYNIIKRKNGNTQVIRTVNKTGKPNLLLYITYFNGYYGQRISDAEGYIIYWDKVVPVSKSVFTRSDVSKRNLILNDISYFRSTNAIIKYTAPVSSQTIPKKKHPNYTKICSNIYNLLYDMTSDKVNFIKNYASNKYEKIKIIRNKDSYNCIDIFKITWKMNGCRYTLNYLKFKKDEFDHYKPIELYYIKYNEELLFESLIDRLYKLAKSIKMEELFDNLLIASTLDLKSKDK